MKNLIIGIILALGAGFIKKQYFSEEPLIKKTENTKVKIKKDLFDVSPLIEKNEQYLKDGFINIADYLPKDRSKENAENITNAINGVLKAVAGNNKNEKFKLIRLISPRTIYFPPGIYYINKTLGALLKPDDSRDPEYACSLRLVGAGSKFTTIQLVNDLDSFKENKKYKYMIQMGNDIRLNPSQANSAYGNYIEGITLNVGNNKNAGGVAFSVANMGSLKDVRIISGTYGRAAGPAIFVSDHSGPGLIKDTQINGFQEAINFVEGSPKNNIVVSNVDIYNSKIGIVLGKKQIQMEFIKMKNIRIPFLVRSPINASVITDSLIINKKDKVFKNVIKGRDEALIYVRDVNYEGYDYLYTDKKQSIKGFERKNNSRSRLRVFEWSNQKHFKAGKTKKSKMRKRYYGESLENKKTPRYDKNIYETIEEHAYVTKYGAIPGDDKDDTAAFQKAIDSGNKVVMVPYGEYNIDGLLYIRKNVEYMDFLFSNLKGPGKIVVEKSNPRSPTASKKIFISNLLTRGNMNYGNHIHFIHESDKTVVMENVRIGVIKTTAQTTGELYIDNIGPRTVIDINSQTYSKLRQYNREISWWNNHGGQLYITGDNLEGKTKQYHTTATSGEWNENDKSKQNWTYPYQKTSTTSGGGFTMVMGGAIDSMKYLTYDSFKPNPTYSIITKRKDPKNSKAVIIYSGFSTDTNKVDTEQKRKQTGGKGSFEFHIKHLDQKKNKKVAIKDNRATLIPYKKRGRRTYVNLYHSE